MALAAAGYAGETQLSAKALDAIVAANGATHGIPAQAVFVSHNGKLVYQRFVGTRIVGRVLPVGPGTVFPIYSVSKLFAATLLFQQVEAGKVDLDAPAARYAPSLPAAWRAITVRQVLNHASGAPEYFDEADPRKPFPPTLHAVFAALSDRPLLFQPGSRSRYTNTNFLVVEAILEAVTGKPYSELVRTRLIAPLGLKETWLNSADAPADRMVANYLGANGRITPEDPIPWQPYALSHVGVADVARFLDAVADGRFVSTARCRQCLVTQIGRLGPDASRSWCSAWPHCVRALAGHRLSNGDPRTRLLRISPRMRWRPSPTCANGQTSPGHIGLISHSEGAVVAPAAAVRTGAVAFLVLTGAPAVPGDQLIERQRELVLALDATHSAAFSYIDSAPFVERSCMRCRARPLSGSRSMVWSSDPCAVWLQQSRALRDKSKQTT